MFLIGKSVRMGMVFAFLMTGMLAVSLIPPAFAGKSNDDIKEVQQALADKGYNPGPIDGAMGSQTRQAIGRYQKAEDLPVTNHMDAKTADKLGVPQGSVGGTFKTAGKDVGEGGKEFGHDIKEGKPVEAGKDLGKGIGKGGEKTGEGTQKAVTP
jgi:peptidoglycan hydrolase-like protein with peptidoglycan-binding domain